MSAEEAVASVRDPAELEQEALAALDSELPAAIALRHHIHQQPRVGGDEWDTTTQIRDALDARGVDVEEGIFLRIGAAELPAVAIRAELDALPIQEASGSPWASHVDGVAHLCAHDIHIAALVAVLRTARTLDLPLAVVGVFQPREEIIPSGARDFLHHEAFLRENIRAMVGVHLQPVIPQGFLSTVPGPVNASADDFVIKVLGTPGHGGYPHLANDPIVAASAIVQALQTLVSRLVDPMNPTVLTIGTISGGDSPNQVPEIVTLSGTLRSFDEHDRDRLQADLHRVVTLVAEAHGCRGEVDMNRGEPVLRNDERLTAIVSRALDGHGYLQAPPFRSCGADDFAFYSQRFPSLMIFTGVGPGGAHAPGLHHPQYVPGDDSVRDVARIMMISLLAVARTALPL